MQIEATWLMDPPQTPPLPALLVRPQASGPLPGVLLVQDVFGLGAHFRDIARRLAEAGYVVLAPDLYVVRGGQRPTFLSEPRIALAKDFLDALPFAAWGDADLRQGALEARPPELRAQLTETLDFLLAPQRPWEAWTSIFQQALHWLAQSPWCRGRSIGALGFCLGGGIVGRFACAEPDLRAGVIFYGAPPPAEQLGNLRAPLLALHGADDARLVGTLPAFEAAMRTAGKSLETHIYPGAPHAFFNDTRKSYRIEAARDAWARTLMFFATHLQ